MNARFPFYKIKHKSPKHHLYDNWKALNEAEICDLVREKVNDKIEIRFVYDDKCDFVGRVNFNLDSAFNAIPCYIAFNEKYKKQWYKFQILHEIGHLLHYYSKEKRISDLYSKYDINNIKVKSYLEKIAILNAMKISKKDEDISSLFGTVFATFDFLRLVDYDEPNEPIKKPMSPEHSEAANQILKMKSFKKICNELNSEFLKEEIIPV